MDKIEKWIRQTVGNASDREIARLADIGQSTLSRQRRDGTVTVETAVKIARAYQVSVVPALLAMDVLTEFDLKAFSTSNGVLDASDEELISEILRRMKAGQADWAHQPISQLESDLDQRRAERSNTSAQQVHTPDYDQLITDINSGKEQVAAQEATEPLEEHHP